MSYFENARARSQGIDPNGIIHFIEETERKGLEMHRLMIVRHGKCVAKGSWHPYQNDDMHPLFSFSKSLTATAIGFLVQEGVLTTDDKLVDFFPELVPEVDEISREGVPSELPSSILYQHLMEIRIYHLLTMSCGHEYEITDKSTDWLKTFFRHPVIFEPGTFYKYNTAGTNVLSAIIKKVTGLDLTDYLRPRLFEPLGIKNVTCESLPDHTQMGGSGFRLSLEDMARFTYFMLRKGYWEGKAILPGWYEIAGSKQIDTAGDSEGHIKEWAQGYGYQCWMCSRPESFRADGAFGQFGFVYPDLDLIVITNAATEQTQSLVDIMYQYLIPAVYQDENEVPSTDNQENRLAEYMKNLRLPAMRYSRHPTAELWLNDRVYHLCRQEDQSVSASPSLNSTAFAGIPKTTGFSVESSSSTLEDFPVQGLNPDRAEGKMQGLYGLSNLETLIGGNGLRRVADDTNIEEMSFHFTEETVIWNVKENSYNYQIEASFSNTFLRKKTTLSDKEVIVAASAGWRSQNVLEMEIRRMDTGSGVRLLFRFQGKMVRIEADDTLITDGGLGVLVRRLAPFICQ